MKIKILYLTFHSEIGGGETSLCYLLQKQNHQRFQALVVVPYEGQLSQRLNDNYISTITINLPAYLIRSLFIPGFSVIAFYKLYKLSLQYKPDIIHLNHAHLILYGGLLGKLLHVKVVATFHGTWDLLYRYQAYLYQFFLHQLLPITQEVHLHLLNFNIISPKKITTVTLGVNTDLFRPAKNKSAMKKKMKFNPNMLVIAMACRFDITKNHIGFLRVAKGILKSQLKVIFLLIGDTTNNLEHASQSAVEIKRNLDEFLDRNIQLRAHIKFTGYTESIEKIYQATDIICSTSLSETLPVSLIEAAACGLPIVAYKNISTWRIIKDNYNGYVAPFDDEREFLENLQHIIKNPKLRIKFGRNSRRIAVKKFSLTHYEKSISQIYQKLLGF